jgi:hypothetical protein
MKKLLYLLLLIFPVSCSSQKYITDIKMLVELDGKWLFKIDPEDKGLEQLWYSANFDRSDWTDPLIIIFNSKFKFCINKCKNDLFLFFSFLSILEKHEMLKLPLSLFSILF